MTAKILTQFKQQIQDLVLVPAGGGVFEVKFDDDLVWSKAQTKQFPEEEKLLAQLEARLGT